MSIAIPRLSVVGVIITFAVGLQAAEPDPVPALVQKWQVKEFQHQPEASGLYVREGFVYTGGGAPQGKVAKLDVTTGAAAWVHETHQTYQPSHPVSNGRAVVFGTFYHVHPDGRAGGMPNVVALDDRNGAVLWRVPTTDQNMSAACFGDELVFIGSYDQHLYAIDWTTGAVRWKTKLGAAIRSTPCMTDDTVAVGCYDGLLYFLDRKTGKVNASVECGGRIEADPVVCGDVVLVAVDQQTLKEPYNSSKVRKSMLAVNSRQGKVVARFVAEGSFDRRVAVVGADAYFFDDANLYSFDSKLGAISWKVKAPQGLKPCPIVTPTQVILAFNTVGRHGGGTAKVVVFDRKTGRERSSADRGGVSLGHGRYAQTGDIIVAADPDAAGFQLVPYK